MLNTIPRTAGNTEYAMLLPLFTRILKVLKLARVMSL
jgi:hypothetical protein